MTLVATKLSEPPEPRSSDMGMRQDQSAAGLSRVSLSQGIAAETSSCTTTAAWKTRGAPKRRSRRGAMRGTHMTEIPIGERAAPSCCGAKPRPWSCEAMKSGNTW